MAVRPPSSTTSPRESDALQRLIDVRGKRSIIPAMSSDPDESQAQVEAAATMVPPAAAPGSPPPPTASPGSPNGVSTHVSAPPAAAPSVEADLAAVEEIALAR